MDIAKIEVAVKEAVGDEKFKQKLNEAQSDLLEGKLRDDDMGKLAQSLQMQHYARIDCKRSIVNMKHNVKKGNASEAVKNLIQLRDGIRTAANMARGRNVSTN